MLRALSGARPAVGGQVWEGDGVVASFRKLVGATNPLQAEPGTLRGDFGRVTGRNIVHASDSPDNGEREAGAGHPHPLRHPPSGSPPEPALYVRVPRHWDDTCPGDVPSGGDLMQKHSACGTAAVSDGCLWASLDAALWFKDGLPESWTPTISPWLVE